jgi:hypothetical protein
VKQADVADFFDVLANWKDTPEYIAKMGKFTVNRADPEFWSAYEWFQNDLDTADPLHTGLYDLNRYFPIAARELGLEDL